MNDCDDDAPVAPKLRRGQAYCHPCGVVYKVSDVPMARYHRHAPPPDFERFGRMCADAWRAHLPGEARYSADSWALLAKISECARACRVPT